MSSPLAGFPNPATAHLTLLASFAAGGAGVSVTATASPGTAIQTISVPSTGQHWGAITWETNMGFQNSGTAATLTTQIGITQGGTTLYVNDMGTTPNLNQGANELDIFRPYAWVVVDAQSMGSASGQPPYSTTDFFDSSQAFTLTFAVFASVTAVTTAIPFGRMFVYGLGAGNT